MNECCFKAHKQLWSFIVHIFVLKDNKSGISKFKKSEYINGSKSFPLVMIRFIFYLIYLLKSIGFKLLMSKQTLQVSRQSNQNCRLYRVNKKNNGRTDGQRMTEALLADIGVINSVGSFSWKKMPSNLILHCMPKKIFYHEAIVVIKSGVVKSVSSSLVSSSLVLILQDAFCQR